MENIEYEVTKKGGEISIMTYRKLPKFSSYFNNLVRNLKIGEDMYEVSSMVNIKRIK